jgi:translation initiation factor 4A
LANQIYNVAVGINQFLPIKVKSFIGGTDAREDRKALQNGEANIAIGTPGRLKQMIERKWLSTNHVKLIILDEADEMINGFQEAMRDIFAELSIDTQVCLISATMPREVL